MTFTTFMSEQMNWETWFNYLSLFAFGLASRLLLSLDYSGDQIGVYTKILKHKGRKWITYEMPDSVVQGTYPYPMLVYYLTSFFPSRAWRQVSILINIVPDLIVGLLLYQFTTIHLTQSLNLSAPEASSFGFYTTLIYLTMPVLFPITSRLKSTNARAPSIFMVTAALVSMELAKGGQSWEWSLVALFFTYLCFIGSFFAMQTIVFFTLIMSCVSLEPVYLFYPMIVIVAGYLFPFLKIKEPLIFKIAHFVWYYKVLAKGGAQAVGNRNLLSGIIKIPKLILKDRRKAIYVCLHECTSVILSYSVPLLGPLLFFLFSSHLSISTLLQDPVLRFCLLVTFSSTFMFVLTSLGKFKMFGQAERYFEYSSPMLALLFVSLGLKLGFLTKEMMVSMALTQIAIIILLHIFSDPSMINNLSSFQIITEDDKDLVNYLGTLPGEVRLATVPIRNPILFSGLSSRFGDKIKYYYRWILTHQMKIDGFKEFIDDVDENMNFMGTPENLKQKYRINYVLLKNSSKNRPGSPFVSEVVQKYGPIYENKTYTLYYLDKSVDAQSTQTIN